MHWVPEILIVGVFLVAVFHSLVALRWRHKAIVQSQMLDEYRADNSRLRLELQQNLAQMQMPRWEIVERTDNRPRADKKLWETDGPHGEILRFTFEQVGVARERGAKPDIIGPGADEPA